MNLFDLAETFIAVADKGSILLASKALLQTSAGISKKISKLEDRLAAQLLIRNRKGVKLTEVGQIYYHEVKKALEQLKIAESSLSQVIDSPRGVLKVVANHYYMETVIIPRLEEFSKAYPRLTLELEVIEIFPDFNLKKMDIIYGISLPGEEGLARKKIATTRYVLCASEKYLREKGIPKSSSELLQHDFIGHSNRRPNNLVVLDQDEQILMKAKFIFNHTSQMIQAALAGLGLIWTHENMVLPFLKEKTLISVMDRSLKRSIPVFAYYPHQKFRDPKIKAFLDFF